MVCEQRYQVTRWRSGKATSSLFAGTPSRVQTEMLNRREDLACVWLYAREPGRTVYRLCTKWNALSGSLRSRWETATDSASASNARYKYLTSYH
ncbi:hypothetical protein BDZ89DRAFT_1072764 [Hymenopellis radicata]|nr:hypothetical protein BDZ89DRAFT_1072764 [Hymenopellis radicata]